MSGKVRFAINVGEFAELLGVSESTVYKLVRQGGIPVVKAGVRRVVIPVAVAEEYLRSPLPAEMLEAR